MAAHNHDDLIKWKNGLLKNQSNKSSNKKKLAAIAIAIGLALVATYVMYS
jgi:hypothetical protein